MTTEYDFAFSRRDASEFFIKPTLNGGSGECRVRAAPAVSRAKLCKEAHTSIQVQRKHSGIPHAMALRLMARSPRRRIRLVTVAGGLRCNEIPVGLAHLRRLDTSNGCRNHTLLPYASTPFVCMLVTTHRQSPPCDSIFMRDAAASTTSHPAFVTIMIRPSSGETGGVRPLICPTAPAKFCPSCHFVAATKPALFKAHRQGATTGGALHRPTYAFAWASSGRAVSAVFASVSSLP
jgi:hypothetical protein